MIKTEERIAHFKALGVPFLEKMPEGWKIIRNATTAPSGYVWIFNCKSPFSSEYRHALLKV